MKSGFNKGNYYFSCRLGQKMLVLSLIPCIAHYAATGNVMLSIFGAGLNTDALLVD